MVGLIQILVNQTHRLHPTLPFLNRRKHVFVLDIGGLNIQQTRNDLEVIFYSVVNLPQQRFFFAQRILNDCFLLLNFIIFLRQCFRRFFLQPITRKKKVSHYCQQTRQHRRPIALQIGQFIGFFLQGFLRVQVFDERIFFTRFVFGW